MTDVSLASTNPQMRLDRAKKHIHDLKEALQSFRNLEPLAVNVKDSVPTGQCVYYVERVASIPSDCLLIVGDALHNLRSALDHLAFQLVTIGSGGVPADPRQIAFPIADSEEKYPPLRDTRLRGARREALAVLDTIKPYSGGNDILWRLNRLDIVNKHRMLLTVACAYKAADIGAFAIGQMKASFPEMMKGCPDFALFVRPADRLCPLKPGDELFSHPKDIKAIVPMRFAFDFAFAEPQIMPPEPVVETLRQMAEEVRKTIEVCAPFL